MKSLQGKRAFITGASAGIGRATALRFAAMGADLVLVARRENKLQSLVSEIQAEGGRAEYLALDLADQRKLSESAKSLADDGGIDILVNNVSGPAPGRLLDATPADFEQGFTVHLFAAQTLVQSFVDGMTERGFGRILNVISTSVREPIPNLGVSNTVRGAMASWAKTLSRELPSGITVNNILPGFTNTERLAALRAHLAKERGVSEAEVEQRWLATVPEGRLAEPSEVAAAIGFLASPEAGFIRGVNLAVDGGRTTSIA